MPTRNDHDQLDDRKAAILRSVVTGYVETAQPVGSSQVRETPSSRSHRPPSGPTWRRSSAKGT